MIRRRSQLSPRLTVADHRCRVTNLCGNSYTSIRSIFVSVYVWLHTLNSKCTYTITGNVFLRNGWISNVFEFLLSAKIVDIRDESLTCMHVSHLYRSIESLAVWTSRVGFVFRSEPFVYLCFIYFYFITDKVNTNINNSVSIPYNVRNIYWNLKSKCKLHNFYR